MARPLFRLGRAPGIEVLYRQARALVRGEQLPELPGELPIATPGSFVCQGPTCAGETFTVAVRRRDPAPVCPRCGRPLHRGAWSRRSERARQARPVNSPQLGRNSQVARWGTRLVVHDNVQ